MKTIFFCGMMVFSAILSAQPLVPDLGNGMYRNPVICADYSDPDVIRNGEDFYMVASSFNVCPGLPVLQSRDLVSWTIVNHVLKSLEPADVYSVPGHGNGCWAPSIRLHNGQYYVYYSDPDYGIFMSKTKDILGEWDKPVLVKDGKGWIDPCPLWDDNGNAYLVNAFAGSRSGMKSILVVSPMSSDGTRLTGESVLVVDGHSLHTTVEGPKFYKRNGYYYIFAPAGGVPGGWQTVFRSKNIYGPYEDKIVMHQGGSSVNGPHQGAWVELANRESWFIHFQDRDAYGRIVHLQPMTWVNDWPVIGVDRDGDGIGEPVDTFRKPGVKNSGTVLVPQTSDEFSGNSAGLQWQWHANPRQEWMFCSGASGFVRLYCMLLPDNYVSLWQVPNLFLQKFPATEFTATTKLTFSDHQDGDKTGLLVMGNDYAYLSVYRENGTLTIGQTVCVNAANGGTETAVEKAHFDGKEVWLRVKVTEGGICRFSYSSGGIEFIPMGREFRASPGRWIGAKVGLFALSTQRCNDKGYADYDWFRIE
jgi:beta-xylosidase